MYPDIENLNIRPGDRNFKFDRTMRGYDPQQVDEKLNDLYARIEKFMSENLDADSDRAIARGVGIHRNTIGKNQQLKDFIEKIRQERREYTAARYAE